MDFQLQTAEEACSWATKQENFERYSIRRIVIVHIFELPVHLISFC